MNKLLLLLSVTLFLQYEVYAQTEFDLKPDQSMLMTGKGPGQDATINPYEGQNCIAIVENIGRNEFSIRTQQRGKIIDTISIKQGEVKRIPLLKGNELYFDAYAKGQAKAKVEFEEWEE